MRKRENATASTGPNVEENEETALAVKPAETIAELDAKLQKEFKRRVNLIHKQVDNIQRSFISIAFQLHWIKERNMFKLSGCKNIYEYADQEFGIGRSSCGNLICIVEHYAKRDEGGNIIESIAEQYQAFSAYQLVAMIGMSDETKAIVTPDMSTRAIQRLKKEKQLSLTGKTIMSRRLESGTTVRAAELSDDDTPPWDTAENTISSESQPEPPRVDTLLMVDSFADYQRKLDRISAMVEQAFEGVRPVTVKIVCEQI